MLLGNYFRLRALAAAFEADVRKGSGGRDERTFSTIKADGLDKSEYVTQVLSFGDGSNGALGHDAEGYLRDAFEPVPVHGLPNNIVKVAAGHYHSLAVTYDGEVWAWGRNVEGQLGRRHGNSREDWRLPRKVEGLEGIRIKDVGGSGVVSMAIAVDGSLWSWGSSKRGQLGLSSSLVQSLLPQKIESLSGYKVSQVALGWGHVLACTADGELFAWGYGEEGRLGYSTEEVPEDLRFRPMKAAEQALLPPTPVDVEDEELFKKEKSAISVWRPCAVEALAHEKVRSVACGMDHSLVLTEDGKIYSFGDNSLGQLGRAESDEESIGALSFPDGQTTAVGIAAGLGHSLAITDSSSGSAVRGNLYSWGWNSASQLGRPGEGGHPGLVEGLEEETMIEAKGGRAHSVGLTLNNEVCVWGSGRNGRLGLGSSSDELYPFPIESLSSVSVLQVSCGFDHSLVLVRSVS
ncbi:hypothetical protein R1sor_023549 [Riccia sorocarpa]|uniref:RCC1-like domain-containing protein n=1 Tax=Riccia sorocarpa TaxID=122646 RepID=A0ABD3GN29_9MARC